MSRGYSEAQSGYWQKKVQRRRLLQIGFAGGLSAVALPLLGCSSNNTNTNSAATSAATRAAASAAAAGASGTAAARAASAAASPAARAVATGSPAPAAAAAANVRRGGKLRFGFSRDFEGFDPGAVADSYVGFLFVAGIYDPLVRYTADYQVAPGIATKWEVPDPQTLVFTIRDGVKFHDGDPVTADAVKANIDRIISAASKAKDKASLSSIDSTAAQGSTFTIKLKNPDAVVLPVLGDYAGMIASPKAFADLMTKPVGSGAFKLQSWDKGAKITLVKNDDYWEQGPGGKLPYLDGMETTIIPDAEQQLNSLKSGQVDLLTIITGETIDRIKSDNNLQYVTGPSRLVRTQFLNMAWPEVSTVPVRQAVAQAIDRKAIVDAVYAGHAQIAATMGTPGDWVFDSKIAPYPFDIAAAKKLLAQANMPNGFKLVVKTTNQPGEFQTISDLIRPQLKQIGVDYSYETIDPTASFKILYQDGNTGASVAGNDGRADFAQVVDLSFTKNGTFNFAGHFDKNWQTDPDIDALITKGRQTLDQAQRKVIYSALQQQVHDKVYSQDVLCYPEQGWGVSKKVQNLAWYQDARFRLNQVFLLG